MSDDEMGLVMPFVTTVSNGGVHEDKAYVAGYEMGNLDAVLGVAAALDLLPDRKVIHAENRPQTDLLAMRHGYWPSFVETGGSPEWLIVDFERASGVVDEDES